MTNHLTNIIEAALLTAGEPLSLQRLKQLFIGDNGQPTLAEVQNALTELADSYTERGIQLNETASGYMIIVKPVLNPWLKNLWPERPSRPSRALLETLALIAYRQPITRGEIEEVRGVSVSTNIIRSLLERQWIQLAGQREVPGRPSLYATTAQFLDDFNLKSLAELPSLTQLQLEIRED